MKKRLTALCTLWLIALIGAMGCARKDSANGKTAAQEIPHTTPQRIISMAPSITETLFALGLGDRLVGVTNFCNYPPAARDIVKMGGFADPSYEAIVSMQPDLVILLTAHRDGKRELERLGIKTLTVPHKTVSDVHDAIRIIGDHCGAAKQAQELLKDLSDREQMVEKAISGLERPRVLICIGRDTENGQLADMYMAGRNGFYDEIITMAGGLNAYEDDEVAYPQLSAEGVLAVDPEVLIDLVSPAGEKVTDRARISAQWHQLRTLAAVKTSRLHVIGGDYALRPGPRFVQFLEEMARLLHPSAFGGE